MHRYSTHLDSHKLVRGWSGSDSAGLHVLVSLLADWLSSACLNIRMELQILRAGPSLTLMIFTMSRCVRRRNALPSICQQRGEAVEQVILSVKMAKNIERDGTPLRRLSSRVLLTKILTLHPCLFYENKCILPQ